MPPTTVQRAPGTKGVGSTDPIALERLNHAADDMARLFDLADEIRTLPPERRPQAISVFLAYTGSLAALIAGTHDHDVHVELADRLWMVCATPDELSGLAVTASASWADGLIGESDALRIAGACARTLGGVR